MTDYFALLGVPRRPWMDEDLLKEKFHALAVEHHPDVAADSAQDFAAVNAAYRTLRDPKLRLGHWLELEASALRQAPAAIPAGIADLFGIVAHARHSLDAFISRRSRATTSLSQALIASEKSRLLTRLEETAGLIENQHERLLERLRELDTESAAIAEIYNALCYLSKWREQLRESIAKLVIE